MDKKDQLRSAFELWQKLEELRNVSSKLLSHYFEGFLDIAMEKDKTKYGNQDNFPEMKF